MITVPQIIEAVAAYYHTTAVKLVGRDRRKSECEDRHMAMALSRRYTRLSLEEIGDFFGGRDHTTVMHACKVIKKLVASDEMIAGRWRVMLETMNGVQRKLTGGSAGFCLHCVGEYP